MPPNNLSGTITLNIKIAGMGAAGGVTTAGRGVAGTGLSSWTNQPIGPFSRVQSPSQRFDYEKIQIRETKGLKEEAEYIKKIGIQESFLNKPAMKAISKFIPIIGGAGGILALVKYSKIMAQTMSIFGQLGGSFFDILLAPFIPALAKYVLEPMAKGITTFSQIWPDTVKFFGLALGDTAKSVWDNIKTIAIATWETIKIIGTGFWDIIKAVGKLKFSEAIDALSKMWGDLIINMRETWEQLKEPWKKLGDTLDNFYKQSKGLQQLYDILMPESKYFTGQTQLEKYSNQSKTQNITINQTNNISSSNSSLTEIENLKIALREAEERFANDIARGRMQ